MKSKVIVFHLLNNFTGSPMVLRNVLELLIRNGYEVDLYTSVGDGFLSGIRGINYKKNYYTRSNFIFFTFFTFFLSQIFLFWVLLLKLPKKNAIVYVNTILPFSSILAGKFLRLPVIVHVHEDRVHPKILNSFLFFFTNKFSKYLILVSKYLLKNHSNSKSEISVVYNSVSSEFLAFPKPFKNKTADIFKVLMLASLRPYKGLSSFLEVSKMLPGITFNLVLSDSSQDVVKYFESQRIPQNMNIYPLQKNVHVFYGDADIVMNLSDRESWVETFGMTILEAMYYRLPVIVPIVGGITELVEDGKNGFLLDSKDVNSIVERINFLKSDHIIREKMGNRSLELTEYFSVGNFEKGIIDVLEKAFNSLKKR